MTVWLCGKERQAELRLRVCTQKAAAILKAAGSGERLCGVRRKGAELRRRSRWLEDHGAVAHLASAVDRVAVVQRIGPGFEYVLDLFSTGSGVDPAGNGCLNRNTLEVVRVGSLRVGRR